jgi:hypothetical protein
MMQLNTNASIYVLHENEGQKSCLQRSSTESISADLATQRPGETYLFRQQGMMPSSQLGMMQSESL